MLFYVCVLDSEKPESNIMSSTDNTDEFWSYCTAVYCNAEDVYSSDICAVIFDA